MEALNEIVHQKKTDDGRVPDDEPVHCSELDHQKLYEVIKRTFLQLDQQMKQVVKDDSGCVCVSYRLTLRRSYHQSDTVRLSDLMFDWTGRDLFDQHRRFTRDYLLK